MLKKSLSVHWTLIILLFGFPRPLAAELSPEVYRGMQKAAPEYLSIDILSVETAKRANEVLVSARVKVVEVHRSQSNLEIGKEIQIEYAHDTRKLMGPRPIPILQKGKKVPAFLTKHPLRQHYEPAARGFSFEVVR